MYILGDQYKHARPPLHHQIPASQPLPRSGQVYLSGSTCPQPLDNTFRLPQIVRSVTGEGGEKI